jgi:hypothetical protein
VRRNIHPLAEEAEAGLVEEEEEEEEALVQMEEEEEEAILLVVAAAAADWAVAEGRQEGETRVQFDPP